MTVPFDSSFVEKISLLAFTSASFPLMFCWWNSLTDFLNEHYFMMGKTEGAQACLVRTSLL